MVTRRTVERLLSQIDDARGLVARLLEEMPRPPRYERDTDGVEVVMRGSGVAWTSADIATRAEMPRYRARQALASLVAQGRVAMSGTTRGRRYRLVEPRSGEPDLCPTGMG